MVAFAALSKRTGGVDRLVLRTPAKVNLALEILGKRADGYHEISTVLQAVDLFDRLTVEDAEDLSLICSDPDLPTDDGNLVMRAARALATAAGVARGARMAVDKRIPVAAGLGGGSSDAAAALMALNSLWGLRWSRARLAEVAVALGMDVPFFLGRGRARATGRGERLWPLPGDGGYALVLVNPGFPLSTREVYGRVPPGWRAEASGTGAVVSALRMRSAAGLAAALTNHLEDFVAPAVVAIGRMKAALLAAGGLGAAMSGSGPTVFAVARSLDHAQQIRRRVNRAGWSCWSVRTVSGPAITVSRVATAPAGPARRRKPR
ncbi:MAG TPA: 4-(cytidine 5'-diphospho)-2-C-methyl-D-erythritol kinase [Candidatus Binatia bacterium]|nr:4-(cytidine 5'-diphospho)-2-C-methyl-D-erythritol kinase [Candidatus Binatia bacterium]